MKKQKQCSMWLTLGFFAAFLLWTASITFVAVQPVGPKGTSVGFAPMNVFFHRLTGVHWSLYTVTDWLGLVPVCFMAIFAVLGLAQWIRRKHILKVDRSILVLGVFYLAVTAAYLFFESVVINFRPVLVNGFLEASYPSSTTLLVLTVMPTAAMQLKKRLQSPAGKSTSTVAIGAFIIFMVVGRLLSGVHWFSDIIGGILLSAALVSAYAAFSE